MTIPAYPSELPPPLRADFADQSGEGRSFFRPDAGPAVPSLRFAAVSDVVPFSTQLERWQLGVFDKFYEETTKKGALPFTIPAPLIDGFAMLDENLDVLLDENDQPLLYTETMLVMFADQGLPARSQIDVEAYRVTFRLARLPS
ncbi:MULTISPECIES: hypothetical protein [unclassified Rhizobium]|uniref:hypothetical protein n=1 Tax=unclassified Rhizobium TaxID=2613769 RepID=UPI0007148E04|nr:MULTISPECIES: hypothetical protein [unclassified Rhizobium]KQS84119.1 hypothetical protein ASG50_29970 [Rhizobium sp. Leaf386]KQT03218.1 hypothetical protein ASG42_24735 [Rhizobium sp. Leaf391]KQU08387.1 hypothetical protein ASG68_22625 [Rhizobium sp. Leaf453]